MKNQTTNAVSTPAIKVDEEFKVGTVYEDFTCGKGYTSYKVTARTAKFVTVANLTDGTEKRCKIDFEQKKYYANGYHTVEFISPDKKANGFSASDIDHKAMQQIKAALVEDIVNEYAVSPEAQDAAVDAEVEQAAVTVAENEIDGYDETAFDLLPIITDEEEELREYLYDFDEKQEVLADKYEVNAPAKLADTNKISEEPETARPAWWPTLGEFQYQLTLANKRLASLQKSLDINESFLRDISPEEYGMDYIKTVNGAHEINAYLHEDIKRAKENVADIEEKITELVSEIADECAVTAEAQDAAVDAEVEQAADTVNAEIKIETKISANGTANVYVNGKRTSREAAVKFAEENNLPTYTAICYPYSERNYSISEEFATALSAYKWIVSKANSNRNVADGSFEIRRYTDGIKNETTIFDYTENGDEKINADDEPEFATFIYAEIGEVHISERYDRMVLFHNQLANDGLTEEQINQVLVTQYNNENGREHCKLIKEFKAQNGIVEVKPSMINRSEEPDTTAEIEQAAATIATETKISEEPEITKAEKITAVIADAKDFIATNLDARTEKVFKLCFGIHASIHFYLNNLKGKLFSELHAIEDEMSKFKGTEMKFYDAYLAASDGYLDSEEMTALYYHICDCVAGGYSTAVYDQTRNIAKEILDKLGEETLMREIAKVTDEFGISRDLLNQSDHCDFKPFNLDTAHDTPAEISEEPEIDEDEVAEKFYRETESTYRKMQSKAYRAHKFLYDHVFDIYDFDYALKVRNQRGELKVNPNKFHLVDTRFDVEVDRNELDYVIYYGGTELARYRKIESVNNAVDKFAIAIANHDEEFTFPAEVADTHAETEIDEDEYAVSPEAQDAAVDAEIEQAAATIATETKISEEPEITKADSITDELAAALKDIYIADTFATPDENDNVPIIPAVDFFTFAALLYLTDICTTAYRKNPDGTFTEDEEAYKRLHEVKMKFFDEMPDTPDESTSKVAEYLNANAPEGWAVIRDKEKLRVEYQGKFVADAERVTDRDLIVPQAFFRQFEPLIDKSKTPAQIFLDDRYRELAELEEMRKSPDCTPAAIETLDEMINRLKRDIVEAEMYERDSVAAACKAGIFDEEGNLAF